MVLLLLVWVVLEVRKLIRFGWFGPLCGLERMKIIGKNEMVFVTCSLLSQKKKKHPGRRISKKARANEAFLDTHKPPKSTKGWDMTKDMTWRLT